MRFCDTDAQSKMMNDPVARGESLWMVRAAAPFPQPVSPTRSSVESVGAMR
jgi:hypothetical protein